MLVLKKLTKKVQGIQKLPCLALAIFGIDQVLNSIKSPYPIPHKEDQVVLEPQNEKGPSTSSDPNLSTFTAQEM